MTNPASHIPHEVIPSCRMESSCSALGHFLYGETDLESRRREVPGAIITLPPWKHRQYVRSP